MSVGRRQNGGELEPALTKSLFSVRLRAQGRQRWSVTKDGQKFLILVPEERKAGPFTVALNWPDLLEKKYLPACPTHFLLSSLRQLKILSVSPTGFPYSLPSTNHSHLNTLTTLSHHLS